jgi:hypothetical protein
MAERRTAIPITLPSGDKICDKSIWRQRSGMGKVQNLYRTNRWKYSLVRCTAPEGRLATGPLLPSSPVNPAVTWAQDQLARPLAATIRGPVHIEILRGFVFCAVLEGRLTSGPLLPSGTLNLARVQNQIARPLAVTIY